MTDDNGNDQLSPLDALRRYVPLAVWVVVILVILAIPLKIISYGYLPGDDALRHAAKAVSGKPWSEILVLNHAYRIDHEFGWNLLLEKIHQWENWDAEALVIFSVVALFVLAGWSVLPWLKRPEAWLITLTAAMIVSDLPQRFTLGRPFLVTLSVLMTLLLWQMHSSSSPKWPMILLMTGLFALSTFVHGAWYLWVLLIAAFFFAGQFRWGSALTAGWVAGVLLGSALTGHLVAYPAQAVKLALLAGGMHPTTRTMASELQPFGGDVLALIILGGLLILRQLAKLNARPLTATPAFWLVCFCWVLAFRISRFWEDWGWPALMVLMTCDLQLLLQARFAADSFKRLGLVCGLGAAAFLCLTSRQSRPQRLDAGQRRHILLGRRDFVFPDLFQKSQGRLALHAWLRADVDAEGGFRGVPQNIVELRRCQSLRAVGGKNAAGRPAGHSRRRQQPAQHPATRMELRRQRHLDRALAAHQCAAAGADYPGQGAPVKFSA